MKEKSLSVLRHNSKTLFSPYDKRKTFNMAELIEASGFPQSTLKYYVARGEIPGAMQPRKKGRWRFEREGLEIWWASIRQTQLVTTK